MCYKTGKRDYSFDIDKNDFSYFKRLLAEEETVNMSRSYSSVLVGEIEPVIRIETRDVEPWQKNSIDWRKVNWGDSRPCFPLPPFYFCSEPEPLTPKTEMETKTKPDKKEKLKKYLYMPPVGVKRRIKSDLEKVVQSGLLKNIKMAQDSPLRSGAIITTRYRGKTYFCLGIDAVHHELTDFSGGVKKGETVIEGGLRELEEESLGIFGKIRTEDVLNSTGFYTNNMLIMLIHLNVDIQLVRQDFHSRLAAYKKGEHEENKIEVSDLIWLNTQELVGSIRGNSRSRKMYSRVKKMLFKMINYLEVM